MSARAHPYIMRFAVLYVAVSFRQAGSCATNSTQVVYRAGAGDFRGGLL